MKTLFASLLTLLFSVSSFAEVPDCFTRDLTSATYVVGSADLSNALSVLARLQFKRVDSNTDVDGKAVIALELSHVSPSNRAKAKYIQMSNLDILLRDNVINSIECNKK